MYIIGCQVYEDEEIMGASYLSIYEQNPDDYIVEDSYDFDNDFEYEKVAIKFIEKMKI